MATTKGLGITRSQLDAGRKKIAASLKSAALEDLYHKVPAEMAALLGAGSVRFFLRDPLTEELYARIPEGRRVRETRVPARPVERRRLRRHDAQDLLRLEARPDPRREALRRRRPGAQRRRPGGVMELTHGTKDTVIDEERLKIFNDLVLLLGRRLQEILATTVRATPYDYLVEAGSSPATACARRARKPRSRTAPWSTSS
jgi:hypothetical protein